MTDRARVVTADACARIGILGNPSDGYGGQAIAATWSGVRATVSLTHSDRVRWDRDANGESLESVRAFAQATHLDARDDALPLLRAAANRFCLHIDGSGGAPAASMLDDPDQCVRIELSTAIPRQVGLSGSSAIVIAMLRALRDWFAVEISVAELARLALDAEVVDLGIAAGPMDRMIQSHEGVLHMDFGVDPAATRVLDAASLPPIFVAWNPSDATSSNVTHSDLRQRWRDGERAVHDAMASFREIVTEGLDALERRDPERFGRAIDANFDLRASICTIAEADREMIAIGRAAGASTKFCGSGGSVLAVARDTAHLERLERDYRDAGFAGARFVPSDPRVGRTRPVRRTRRS